MTYSFRVRCKLYHDTYLESGETEIILSEVSGQRVRLACIPNDRPIREASELVISGSGYESRDEAAVECDRWTSYVKTGLAGSAFGADFFSRAGRSGFTQVAIEQMEGSAGARIINDEGIPVIFMTEPEPSFVWVGPLRPRKGIPAARVLNQIRHSVASGAVMEPALHLAYDLYSSSLDLESPDARLVMLVNAIEALIRPNERSPEIQRLINSFIQEIETARIDPVERQSLLTTLEFQRRESINQAGRRLVANTSEEFFGESPEKFFSRCYSVRSKIVHGAVPRPSLDEVQARASALEIAVGHLISTIATGSEYISE